MSRNKPLFPLFVDLSEKTAVVIGGGKIASRRVQTLLAFVGEIRVIAPEAEPVIGQLAGEGRIVFQKRSYEPADLQGADLVLAATDDHGLNEEIYQECRSRGIPVNIASNQEHCDFQFPAVIRKDPMVIGINGGGRDHRGVKELRERLQQYLEQEK